MKDLLKKILPESIITSLQSLKRKHDITKAYKFDKKRFKKHSTTNQKLDNIPKLRYRILKDYHAIEKGLTLPNPRMGFGKQRILDIWTNCNLYLSLNNNVIDPIIAGAFATLLEYKKFHESNNISFDLEIKSILDKLSIIISENNLYATQQPIISKDNFFKNTSSDFLEFSQSRRSIRDFTSEKISYSVIKQILELANNAPSACNRQAAKSFVYTSKEQINKILSFQNGNAGFTDKINTLFVVTADISAFYDAMERNQAYIDGGIYSMNLLYAIHYYKLGACMLNCSNLPYQDSALYKICDIPNSHVFIGMIAVGEPLDQIRYCNSFRNKISTNQSIH